jgi:Tol biopolymer transport system component
MFSLIAACTAPVEKKQPFPDGLPERDIVFMPYDPFYFHGKTRNTIGFIDKDGNNLEILKFNVAGGSAQNRLKTFSTYVFGPRWSKNRKELVFTIADTPPNIRVIDENGFMFGSDCSDMDQAGSMLSFDMDGNIILWISTIQAMNERYLSEMSDEESLIVRFDLINCQVVDKIYLPFPSNIWILGADISKNILTAMLFDSYRNQYDQSVNPYNVLYYDLLSGKFQTFPGYHPSISDDGSLLAYYSYDGRLRIRDTSNMNESSLVKLFDKEDDFQFVSRPGWSPDNKWLVYNNREGEIFKIDVTSGEKEFLTEGFAPDWR